MKFMFKKSITLALGLALLSSNIFAVIENAITADVKEAAIQFGVYINYSSKKVKELSDGELGFKKLTPADLKKLTDAYLAFNAAYKVNFPNLTKPATMKTAKDALANAAKAIALVEQSLKNFKK